MTRSLTVILERDNEGYYVASIPTLKGCHTQGKSLAEVMERIREAAELCLETEPGEALKLENVLQPSEPLSDDPVSEALRELREELARHWD